MSDVKTTPAETEAPAAKAAKAAPKTVKATVKKTPAVKSKAPAKKKVGKPAEPKLKTATPQPASKPAQVSVAPTEMSFDMNQTIESMTAASNEALKEGFEKTLKSVTEASNFQKETVDALIASATVAGKGIETANANAVAYAKSLMEEGVTATKAFASAKSVQELFEIQSEYTKSAVDSYLAELNKTSDLFSDLVKDSLKPLNARVMAAMELAQPH
ncbi:phasin family protein [Maricaulis parjimensis]|uniref:phasin family protein n=1 Tax=Maricaulis parjimensis TaxID=144023 RepID=UPI001EEE3FB7|nr:phasin family protein [Maricaulis parjimensis]